MDWRIFISFKIEENKFSKWRVAMRMFSAGGRRLSAACLIGYVQAPPDNLSNRITGPHL